MARVLIIDDDIAVVHDLASLVRRLNHEPVQAASCAEGLGAMADPSMQIIISDSYLPDCFGLDNWIDRLKAKTQDRPLILITGEPSEELAAKMQGKGIMAFLAKPFELAFIKGLLAQATQAIQDPLLHAQP